MYPELLHGASFSVRDHPGVGEGEPAPPAGRTGHNQSQGFSSLKAESDQNREVISHPGLLVLPVVPAVPGLRHQQGDDVVLGEAEQSAVVSGRVGEDGLHSGPPVPLQARRHGAGPGQRAGLRWGTGSPVRDDSKKTLQHQKICSLWIGQQEPPKLAAQRLPMGDSLN